MLDKYLVTGSSGFIGFHLISKLCKKKKNQVFGMRLNKPILFY